MTNRSRDCTSIRILYYVRKYILTTKLSSWIWILCNKTVSPIHGSQLNLVWMSCHWDVIRIVSLTCLKSELRPTKICGWGRAHQPIQDPPSNLRKICRFHEYKFFVKLPWTGRYLHFHLWFTAAVSKPLELVTWKSWFVFYTETQSLY